jgi:ribonuclease T
LDSDIPSLSNRFRGFLPVVIDVETGGFDARRDAILEVAATILAMNEDGLLVCRETWAYKVEPFPGANIEQSALDFTGIDPTDPNRNARPEGEVFAEMLKVIRKEVKAQGCTRAILVGHNPTFDLNFVYAAANRHSIKRNPLHPFSSFDTATLAGLAYGQTVLAKACEAAGLSFNNSEAHSASYDCRKTAQLFCNIVNRWTSLGGWDLAQEAMEARSSWIQA